MQNQNKINIKPLLNDISKVIENGINKLLYDFTLNHIMAELNKCKSEMEFYKTELENVKSTYKHSCVDNKNSENSENSEHILLTIDENYDLTESSHLDCNIFEELLSKNSLLIVNKLDENVEEEEEDEEEEEEEEDEEDEEEEEEEEVEEKVEEEDENSVETETEEVEEEVEEEEVELFEIEIDDITYFAESEENGPIYKVDNNGDPGDQIGVLKDGEVFFSS